MKRMLDILVVPGRLSVLSSVGTLVLCTLFISSMSIPVYGQRKEAPPDELLDVGVVEHLDGRVPLDVPFEDHNGNDMVLGDCFDGELPVVLTMNYSSCPMLCSMQLNGLFDGLKAMEDWDLGDKYRMVTVSIDPTESTERSAKTREKYLKLYGRSSGSNGYVCLTGQDKHIKRVADAVGFKYRFVAETGEYAHNAVTIICTPDGRISRYLYGVEYNPQTLRLSMLEASEGKIGSTMDQILLYCFQYDATRGKYAPSAFKLMKLGAISIVLVVGGIMVMFWRRESKMLGQEESEVSEESVESQ